LNPFFDRVCNSAIERVQNLDDCAQ
jgi:hypothetical protein